MTRVLRLTDRCTVSDLRKSPTYQLVGEELTIAEDSILLDGVVVLHRVEPVLLGDVHWERPGPEPVSFRRYTHIEVDPTSQVVPS